MLSTTTFSALCLAWAVLRTPTKYYVIATNQGKPTSEC
jgi:hypothetical protein